VVTLAKNIWRIPKLPKILTLLLLVTPLSCTLNNKVESEWATLQSASSAKCEPWNQNDDVLSVEQVQVFGDKPFGFLTSVRLRNGQSAFDYADFKQSLNIKPMIRREFGASVDAISGFSDSKEVYTVASTGSKIEIRSMSDHVVRHTATGLPKDIRSINAHPVKDGVWLSFRAGDDETALEELGYQFAYFPLNTGKTEVKLSYFPKTPVNTFQASIISNPTDSTVLVIWKPKDKNGRKFYIAQLDPSNKISFEKKSIDVSAEHDVESWTASHVPGGLLLTYVDGDSLIGQANLKVLKLAWKDQYITSTWLKSKSLLNEHVSDPIGVHSSNKSFVLIPKWVDNESTIALYTIGEQGFENAEAVGVFPRGLRVMDAYWDNDIYALIRFRQDRKWQFQLCRIDQ